MRSCTCSTSAESAIKRPQLREHVRRLTPLLVRRTTRSSEACCARREAPRGESYHPGALRSGRGRRDGQTDHPDGRRRHVGFAGDHTLPANQVRRPLPHHPASRSGAEALESLEELARRDLDCRHRVRSPHARDDRHRVARAVATDHARRQTRSAHGLRGHRRRDQGHQRDRPRSLPAEALVTSRRAVVSGPR